RLHSAIGYIAPKDKLEGHDGAIFAERKRKLAEAQARSEAKQRDEDTVLSPSGDVALAEVC
ncbi:MAG: hypothetical protein R8J85_07830, partial [Mariprofundales bacterium]